MPTEDPEMTDLLLPGSAKEQNRYQGAVRVGPLDLVALRYAVRSCGGPSAFSGLAVTWFDQIAANGTWAVCDRYEHGAPVISKMPVDAAASKDELYDVCAAAMQASLGIPVRMVSFGPTETDKLCR